jgi:hypothetical protein
VIGRFKAYCLAIRLKGYVKGDIRDLNPYQQRHNLPCYHYNNVTVGYLRIELSTPSFQGTADSLPDVPYLKGLMLFVFRGY